MHAFFQLSEVGRHLNAGGDIVVYALHGIPGTDTNHCDGDRHESVVSVVLRSSLLGFPGFRTGRRYCNATECVINTPSLYLE